MVFVTSLTSIAPVIIITVIGLIIQKAGWLSEGFARSVSALLMNIALPASVFVSVVHNINAEDFSTLLRYLLIAVIYTIVMYLAGLLLSVVFRIPRGQKGIFIASFASANTIFIGMPLNIAFLGDDSIPYFLAFYIVTIVFLWSVSAGLIRSDGYSEKTPAKDAGRHIPWKKLLSPPLIACLTAILIVNAGIQMPSFAISSLTYLGNLVTPLSLIYIGVVLGKTEIKNMRITPAVWIAMAGRLILAPAVMTGILAFAHESNGLAAQTFIIQAGCPAVMVLPVLAGEGGGDVKFATTVVTVSTIAFVITMPLLCSLIA